MTIRILHGTVLPCTKQWPRGNFQDFPTLGYGSQQLYGHGDMAAPFCGADIACSCSSDVHAISGNKQSREKLIMFFADVYALFVAPFATYGAFAVSLLLPEVTLRQKAHADVMRGIKRYA